MFFKSPENLSPPLSFIVTSSSDNVNKFERGHDLLDITVHHYSHLRCNQLSCHPNVPAIVEIKLNFFLSHTCPNSHINHRCCLVDSVAKTVSTHAIA